MLCLVTDAVFPFEVHQCLQWSNADSYHQSDIVCDFKTAWRCLTVSITLQCGLSAGNFSVVEWYESYRGKLAHARAMCVRLSFLLPPHKSLGTRLGTRRLFEITIHVPVEQKWQPSRHVRVVYQARPSLCEGEIVAWWTIDMCTSCYWSSNHWK